MELKAFFETKGFINFLLGLFISLSVYVLVLAWVIMPYKLSVSPEPWEYYKFKSAISNNKMDIVKRDTSLILDEEVIIVNIETGKRYRLFHMFSRKEEFVYDKGEYYQYVTDEKGNTVCYKDDDEDVLKFIKTTYN